ncbi:MFS transporter [Phytohabitans suffuscus]|uniref:Putative sugar efflux transporter n=1 Tax=Phytohabitans suffuscus TaxID=624315 RepID=A0A6F8YBM7_9ACTN|nr:MFS transporter [Phytohabitans suffuscus]BCB83460.1 putative sugar efflux transporter [Phytohabitans suffuscus]
MTVSRRRANGALVALSVAAFTFVTTEVLPIGLLTVMADDLGRSDAQIGLLVTGYAAVVVLASIPLTRLTGHVPRRQLITVTLAVFVVAVLVSTVAANYWVLLAARLAIALAQALFWSVVASTATGLFPPEVRGRAVARLSVGASLSPVLGVPLGTWIGQQAGWRVAFLVMAAVGLATCVAVAVLVPTVVPAEGGAARGTAPDARRYAILVVACAVGVAGSLTAYTYVTPFLLDVSGFTPAALGPLLLVSGAAGVAGTLTVGRFLDRSPWGALVVPLTVTVAALLTLYTLGAARVAAVAAVALTVMAYAAFAAAVQNRTLQVAPGSTDLAGAGSSTAFNVGIAVGSLLGGGLIQTAGVRSVALAGAALAAAALALLLAEPPLTRSARRSRLRAGLDLPGEPVAELGRRG